LTKPSQTKFSVHRDFNGDDTTKSYINFFFLTIEGFETADDGSHTFIAYIIIVFILRPTAAVFVNVTTA